MRRVYVMRVTQVGLLLWCSATATAQESHTDVRVAVTRSRTTRCPEAMARVFRVLEEVVQAHEPAEGREDERAIGRRPTSTARRISATRRTTHTLAAVILGRYLRSR